MYWYIYRLTALCVRTRNVRANVSRRHIHTNIAPIVYDIDLGVGMRGVGGGG